MAFSGSWLLNSVVKIDKNSFSTDVADATALLDTEALELELELAELPLVLGELTVVMKAPALFGLSDGEGKSAL